MATYCPPIVHSAYLNVRRDRVFAALTTSSGWDAWFTRGAQIDPTPGGRIVLRWRNFGPDHMTVEDSGVVTEIVPGERFAFQWRVGDSATTVAFDLIERGTGGTVVRVSETGYTQSEGDLRALIGCATGWAEALTLLKFYLEHGVVYGEVPREAINVVSRPAPNQANPYVARPVQPEPEAVPSTSGSLLDAEA